MDKKTIAFTGATGFIGARLIKRVAALNQDASLVSLVQEELVPVARNVGTFLKEKFPEVNYQWVVCDIAKPGLGLPEAATRQLRQEISQFYHLAAIYDLAVGRATAWKVNVTGTQNVLDFLEGCQKNPCLFYFSTCYVSGRRRGIIYEDELEHKEGFKNFYEETKYEAEVLVRRSQTKGKRVVILRPGIVCGDSQTGETSKFDGIYATFNFLDRMKFLPVRLPKPGALEAELNIVPVDYVVEATAAIAEAEEAAVGRTCHLADPEPIGADQFYDLCCRTLTGRTAGIRLSSKIISAALSSRSVRRWLKVPKEALTYFNHPCRYDCTNTLRLLQEAGVLCPRFSDYFPALLDFWRQHEGDSSFYPRF